MAALKSQQNAKTFEDLTSLVPILLGAPNIAHFSKALNTHLQTNFGEIGPSIARNTPIILVEPGTKPHANDPRLHLDSGLPIPDTRCYARQAPTLEEINSAAAGEFDLSSLPLSADGERRFDIATATWQKDRASYEKEFLLHRTHDTACLNFILSRVAPDAKEVINSHASKTQFDALPSSCISRSKAYLDIIAIQFSTGNATSTVDAMIKFFSQHQGNAEFNTPAAHFNSLNEQWGRVEPLFRQCANLEELLQMLRTMVAIQSLDQGHRPTLRALEIHLQTYPDFTAMQHYRDLQAGVLAAATSDLARLKTGPSEQSSAFLATPGPAATSGPPAPANPTYGLTPRSGKGPHCSNCFKLFGRYYYHPQDQCRSKAGSSSKPSPPTAPKTNTRKGYAQLAARVAAMEAGPPATPLPLASNPPPPPQLQTAPPNITTQQLKSLLASFTVDGIALSLDEEA